jgi:hypothetical protein
MPNWEGGSGTGYESGPDTGRDSPVDMGTGGSDHNPSTGGDSGTIIGKRPLVRIPPPPVPSPLQLQARSQAQLDMGGNQWGQPYQSPQMNPMPTFGSGMQMSPHSITPIAGGGQGNPFMSAFPWGQFFNTFGGK